MAEIPTRLQFHFALDGLEDAAAQRSDLVPVYRKRVLAVYDALAAEVRLVRERNAELAAQRLELDDRAYYDGRIAELEAALHTLVDLCDGDSPAIYDWWYCSYDCSPVEDAEGRERHAPDCPVTLARAVLSKEA